MTTNRTTTTTEERVTEDDDAKTRTHLQGSEDVLAPVEGEDDGDPPGPRRLVKRPCHLRHAVKPHDAVGVAELTHLRTATE